MTLIKSISGIRGTIGGQTGENLTPLDIVKFASAYGCWVKQRNIDNRYKIVVGRDARISGYMVENIIVSTISALGIDVVSLGLATTPTVEIAVPAEGAQGGIIISASHNPRQWNALKLLNEHGEFLDSEEGAKVLSLAEEGKYNYEDVDKLGSVISSRNYNDIHINEILKLKLVDVKAIRKAQFKIAIDCVNSVGGIVLPKLLKALGVAEVIELYCEPNGQFPHNPEPLPEHLSELSKTVIQNQAHLGFVVDPDVDRLAIVNEDGSMFGEEYTLVAVSDYVLSKTSGNTVSNLSSTRALKDITLKYGGEYTASAVGEVNVVKEMKKKSAIIGGEGNGGVIYPELHYGRDALVGIALFLSHLAHKNMNCSELRNQYPSYVISKNKIELTPEINADSILNQLKQKYSNYLITDVDGVRIDMDEGWVHLRKSNTEPIIRIYAEGKDTQIAKSIAGSYIKEIENMI